MDFSSHSKHRIGVIWPLEYSGVAGIALFQVVRGEKAHSILSYKHRIKCRIRVYFSPEIQRYTMSYRAIGLVFLFASLFHVCNQLLRQSEIFEFQIQTNSFIV